MKYQHPDPNSGQRQTIKIEYVNNHGEVSLEWYTDNPYQLGAVCRSDVTESLEESFRAIASNHQSDIPDSLKGWRK